MRTMSSEKPPGSPRPQGSRPEAGSYGLGYPDPMRRLSSPLRFGEALAQIRFLRTEDAGRVLAFLSSLPPEAGEPLSGCGAGAPSGDRAARLMAADQGTDAALGFFLISGCDEKLVAIGCSTRLGAGDARLEFAVAHSNRRQGIATALFRALAAIMRQRGVTRFVARIQAMLRLFLKAGASLERIQGKPATMAFVSLPAPVTIGGVG
jgi:GNAT superfamily N-acetyltransferase